MEATRYESQSSVLIDQRTDGLTKGEENINFDRKSYN